MTYPESMSPAGNGTAFLCIIFGVFSAANLGTMAPDAASGKAAGEKIFSIIESPSKIDAVDDK